MARQALNPRAVAADADCRCVCGSLVARVVEGGVELKCRRCKRTLLVPFAPGDRSGFAPLEVEPDPGCSPGRAHAQPTYRGQRP